MDTACGPEFLQAKDRYSGEHEAGNYNTADKELQAEKSFMPGHGLAMKDGPLVGLAVFGERAKVLLVTYGLHCLLPPNMRC